MINMKDMLQLDEVFPQKTSIRLKSRKDAVRLAQDVAAALRKERDQLAKDQKENHINRGLLSPSF